MLVFVLHRENWWALIPGGAMLTTALVALLDQLTAERETGIEPGAIMMLGLAATFAVLSRVETPQGYLRWPAIPAAVLLAVGLILLASSVTWGIWLASLLLIVVGVWMLMRGLYRSA